MGIFMGRREGRALQGDEGPGTDQTSRSAMGGRVLQVYGRDTTILSIGQS